MKKIAILGAGGFGTALTVLLANRAEVTLWSAVSSEIEDLFLHHENTRLLPKVPVPVDRIRLTQSLAELSQAEMVIFATASGYVREVAKRLRGHILPDALIANVAKGLEQTTLRRLSQVICEELPNHPFVALSGPSHAEEIARFLPTTIVAASENPEAAKAVQDTLGSETLRVYVNRDIIGVELGGALKNIIALAAGICDGLGLGDNVKAALMTRGITEIGRLGVAAGASKETFAGLSGIGDLIVTCTSMHSRNRRAGILIGQGMSAERAIEKIGMTVEGYAATKAGYDLARRYRVDMPITEQLYRVLYSASDPKAALANLMSRPSKHEEEQFWFD